jgi:hypothetical protein
MSVALPLSASVLICEKVLREDDGVISAIRIVDLFHFWVDPKIPIESQTVKMTLLMRVVLTPSDAQKEHSFDIKLIRPSGETNKLGTLTAKNVISIYPNIPQGTTINAFLDVVPREEGTHYVVVALDGEDVAKTPFTLVKKSSQT